MVSLWPERHGKSVLAAALYVLGIYQGMCFVDNRYKKLLVS
jgi:hypothetical protein